VKVRVCEQESHFCHQAVRGECHSINIEKNEALNYEQKEQAMNCFLNEKEQKEVTEKGPSKQVSLVLHTERHT